MAQAAAKIVLIGSGRMGRIRARAIFANPRLQLEGIVDPNIEQSKPLSELYRTHHFETLSEAISSSSSSLLDGIVISTPTPSHESLITEAAKNNISSIFTEKPVDETADKVSSLFQLCNDHKVKLCCGYQRRFDSSYQSLYDQVSSGAIGTPLTASIFFGDHPVPSREFLLQGGGNIITDCSAHDVDFIRWALKDEVVSVYAVGTSSDDELREKNIIDNATMLLTFSKGTNVTLSLSRGANYGYDQRCEIFGTKGIVSVKNMAENATELANEDGLHRPKWMHSFPQRFAAAFEQEMDAFADTLLSETHWPIEEKDCIAVQRICDAALLSGETSRVIHLDDIP